MKKKILVIGTTGFIGAHVKEVLSNAYDIAGASKRIDNYIDLEDRHSIESALEKIRPQIVINCAGIVENSEQAALNEVFTKNLLEEINTCQLPVERVIISGSAAEYGIVDKKNIPVKEGTPLNANSGYDLSKRRETSFALDYGKRHGLPITVVRIFNPIGVGMHPKFLIPRLTQQVHDIESGKTDKIELSRLDTERDYINIIDVARAVKAIVDGDPKYSVYNIGSGKATSNGELVELVLKNSKLGNRPTIVETSSVEEPLVAIQADISRIVSEFGWVPNHTLEETVKEIVDASR